MFMKKKIDTLYCINVETNQEEEYKYKDLRMSKELRMQLKEKATNNGNIKFFCGCNMDEIIEMKISKGGKYIYNAKNDTIEKHNKFCIKNGKKSEYNPGFKEDEETGVYNIRGDFKLQPPLKKNIKDDVIVKEIDENLTTSKKRLLDFAPDESNGKLTFSAVVKNLNVTTWNKHAKNKNKIDDINAFNKKVWGMSSIMNLTQNNKKDNGVSIQSIFFDPTVDKNIKDKDVKFVYMRLKSLQKLGSFYKIYATTENKYGRMQDTFFNAPAEIMEEALIGLKLKITDELLEKYNIIISGLVYRNKAGYLEFYKLMFMLVNRFGLYSESKYEADYYDLLYECDVYFYKPRWHMDGYGNHIADAESVDTYNGKTVLIEVFGYTADEYLKEREEKIKFIETELKDSAILLQWNPCFGEDIHTREYIKNFFNINK